MEKEKNMKMDSKLKGKLYKNEILEYEGEFLYDKKWNGKGYDKYGNISYELINGNGKVKEYNLKGTLIFEGEYLNGKKWKGIERKSDEFGFSFNCEYSNGKGKGFEYEHGILQFEGEYINGQRNGKGKEYNSDNKIKFEGEYLNGQRNGKGKEYDWNGKLVFEGEYLNGQRNKGIGYDLSGNIIFEGEYLNREYI